MKFPVRHGLSLPQSNYFTDNSCLYFWVNSYWSACRDLIYYHFRRVSKNSFFINNFIFLDHHLKDVHEVEDKLRLRQDQKLTIYSTEEYRTLFVETNSFWSDNLFRLSVLTALLKNKNSYFSSQDEQRLLYMFCDGHTQLPKDYSVDCGFMNNIITWKRQDSNFDLKSYMVKS